MRLWLLPDDVTSSMVTSSGGFLRSIGFCNSGLICKTTNTQICVPLLSSTHTHRARHCVTWCWLWLHNEGFNKNWTGPVCDQLCKITSKDTMADLQHCCCWGHRGIVWNLLNAHWSTWWELTGFTSHRPSQDRVSSSALLSWVWSVLVKFVQPKLVFDKTTIDFTNLNVVTAV